MALLFPWATKEYLLWEMTIGQIIFYNNKAINIKEGIDKNNVPGLNDKSVEELRELRNSVKEQFALEEEEIKKALASKYGDIE